MLVGVSVSVGVDVLVGDGVMVSVGLAVSVTAIALWIASGEGAQPVNKTRIARQASNFLIYPSFGYGVRFILDKPVSDWSKNAATVFL